MDGKKISHFTTIESRSKYTKQVLVRLTEDQAAKLKAKAKKYSDGNLSDWLRYAGLNLDPK